MGGGGELGCEPGTIRVSGQDWSRGGRGPLRREGKPLGLPGEVS